MIVFKNYQFINRFIGRCDKDAEWKASFKTTLFIFIMNILIM